MLREVSSAGTTVVNVDALKSEIRAALITQKANACPIASRLAWHAAGTFDRRDGTGGCNGGTMRFAPESSDPDNAGLSIIRDLLHPVKVAHPEISHADLYAIAGVVAIEFLGGPKVPFNFGRVDHADGNLCPANGRLPNALEAAGHLRDIFTMRMGFTDREIVALSGAHTLGRCHRVRSGFDGPWTTKPLSFDNEYFCNLLNLQWRRRDWDGPEQYEDVETGKLMMLPSDLTLVRDPEFKKYVELYARDEQQWFKDFAVSFAKLISLGCPASANPFRQPEPLSERDKASAEFRELAMHGSVPPARKLLGKADVHQLEATSGRSALHKAAFWGHVAMVDFLADDCKLNVNQQDAYGDTPLHDAAKFGHVEVIKTLLDAGANGSIKNKAGKDAAVVAAEHNKPDVAKLIQEHPCVRSKL